GRLPGAGRSLAGVALAGIFYGIPCFMGGMGMGDLKLAAGVGAWVGPAQFVTASVFTALIGGILAVGWALWHRSFGRSLDAAADLLTPWGARPEKDISTADQKAVNSIPYGPAIAIGTLLSFLAQ